MSTPHLSSSPPDDRPPPTPQAERYGPSPYPAWLRERERALLARRRGVPTHSPRVGLALAGGGLRAATFSLGFLQGWAHRGALRTLDFLSSVSGGGYAAAFLGALHARRGQGPSPERDLEDVERLLHPHPESAEMRRMRRNGRYLAPAGGSDMWLAGAILLRSWLSLLFVVAIPALCCAFTLTSIGSVVTGVFDYLSAQPSLLPGWLDAWIGERAPFFLPVVAGWCAALWGVAYWFVPSDVPATRLRNRASELLKGSLVAAAGLLALALLDAAGRAVARLDARDVRAFLAWVVPTVGTGVVTARKFAAWIPPHLGQRVRLSLNTAALIAALALLVLGAVTVSAIAHASASWLASPDPLASARDTGSIALLLLAATLALGQARSFVNRSSLAALYTARLTRAYLGASNPLRAGREHVTEPIDGDQLEWRDYVSSGHRGPLHIVNVTLNETIDPRVELHEVDRRGMNAAIGPVALSVGVQHHAQWHGASAEPPPSPPPDDVGFRLFTEPMLPPEAELPLGQWTAISGAAVSTGLGSQTSTAFSLLAGVFNLRLGHWWVPGSRPHGAAPPRKWSARVARRLADVFPVYRFLFAEFWARFPGTAIHDWYLTDGGHFENSACYELLRRRLPLIVCCDNGTDPECELEDLSRLTRLARIDFGAELSFLDEAELDAFVAPERRASFGTVAQLRSTSGATGPQFALARVRYADEADAGSLLIWVKPALSGDEPLDVLAYRELHPAFPNESLIDQFFDDVQWESYRKLGQHIGEKLLDTRLTSSGELALPALAALLRG